MQTADGYIIDKCLNGDSAAFGLLVDKYRAGVYALAYSKLRDFRDAEDVAQEVFIKAYIKLRSLKRFDRFHAWLYAITVNLCKDWVRAKSRRPDSEFMEDQDQATLEEPSIDSYEEELVRESIHEALDSLPENYQQVLTLYYLGGMSSREIAEFLGTSPTAIRHRLTRARSQLKEGMVAMMSTTLEEQRLRVTFTFRIMETVKRVKIRPMPRTAEVPWGLSLATGIIFAILSLNPHMGVFDPMDITIGLPVTPTVPEIGEIPVELLEVSQVLVLAGKQEDNNNRNARPPGLGAPPPDVRPAVVDVADDSTSLVSGLIKGKITDTAYPTGHNLEGAVITIKSDRLLAAEGGKKTVVSDSNGEYVFDNLPPGEYIVIATIPGYDPSEDYVTVTPRGEAFHDVRMYLKGSAPASRWPPRLPAEVASGKVIVPPKIVASGRKRMQRWQGVLDIDGNIRRIILKRSTSPPYTATMDSLDQALRDIPVDNMMFDGDNLSFEVKSMNAAFEGKVKEQLGSLTAEGEWKQNGKSTPLTFYRRIEETPEPRRPQEPERPYPYRAEEVIYRNRKAGTLISGTLTIRDTNIPTGSPAVILVSDYGAHDRDQLQRGLGHRPFMVLADYLTRQGIAVLRTDDRGIGWSTGAILQSTVEELADDVMAGIEYLKSRGRKIDPSQIGIIGYGMGGYVAIAAANRSENVASVVLMGGIGFSGEELFLLSGPLIRKSIGQSDKEIARETEITRRAYAVLKQEEDEETAMQKIRDAIADVTVEFSETKLSEAEIEAIRTSSGLEYFAKLNPHFRSFLTFDPGQALTKLKSPILVLNSAENLSIPIKQNLDAIEAALIAGGNTHYTLKEFSDLNGSFQTIQPGVPLHKIEETISPVVLKLIGDWLLEQVSGNN